MGLPNNNPPSTNSKGGYEPDDGRKAPADILTLWFPMSLLIDGAYIVGLEAAIFSPGDEIDYVQERPREELVVLPLLPLPFNPALFVLSGVGLTGTSLLILARILTRQRP